VRIVDIVSVWVTITTNARIGEVRIMVSASIEARVVTILRRSNMRHLNTYYAVCNEKGRFLKYRKSYGRYEWVKNFMSANVGTRRQCMSWLRDMANSPYYLGAELKKIGQGRSAWQVKLSALKVGL